MWPSAFRSAALRKLGRRTTRTSCMIVVGAVRPWQDGAGFRTIDVHGRIESAPGLDLDAASALHAGCHEQPSHKQSGPGAGDPRAGLEKSY
jgi:hypothetical protein